MQRAVTIIGVVGLLAASAGCGGETASSVRTETVTVTAPTEELERAFYFPRGFPKEVPISSVPGDVRAAFEDSTSAVALAPGVWVRRESDKSVGDNADFPTGGLFGRCAAIDDFQRRTGRREGTTCF